MADDMNTGLSDEHAADHAHGATPEVVQPAPNVDELAAARALAEENMAGWKRATADYANLKREMERNTSELAKYAVAGFLGKLLPVLDSFRKATEHRPFGGDAPLDEARVKQWVDGALLIRTQFENVLLSQGVKPIDQAHVPYDPNIHEPMMMRPATNGISPATVIEVLEPGYMLHDKVIRPAKVVVAE